MEAVADDDGAVVVGGGTSVAVLMKTGLLAPSRLVWTGRIERFAAVDVDGDMLRLGGGTTLAQIARSADVQRRCPALATAAGAAANARIRSVATLGGHLAHADPRQDLPPVLLAMGATVDVTGPTGSRTVDLSRLVVGFMATTLADGELVTAVNVPCPAGGRTAYARFAPSSADDFPTVNVAVHLLVDGRGGIVTASVGVGGSGRVPVAVPGVAPLLAERVPSDGDLQAVAAAAAAAVDPVPDHRGSSEYKRDMTALWTLRALRHALQDDAAAAGARLVES